MEASWNLKQLRQFIREEHNNNQYMLDILNSIDNAISIFLYHFDTARDSLSKFYSPDEKATKEHVLNILSGYNEQEELSLKKIENQANIVAAIYTVRSLYDLFAQLVRVFLFVDLVEEKNCNIYLIRDKLEDGELKNCINSVLCSCGFKYIQAFVNVTKHRYLVKHGSSVDFKKNKAGVRFSTFEYKGSSFPALWSDEILELILKTKNSIVQAGKELNNLLLHE